MIINWPGLFMWDKNYSLIVRQSYGVIVFRAHCFLPIWGWNLMNFGNKTFPWKYWKSCGSVHRVKFWDSSLKYISYKIQRRHLFANLTIHFLWYKEYNEKYSTHIAIKYWRKYRWTVTRRINSLWTCTVSCLTKLYDIIEEITFSFYVFVLYKTNKNLTGEFF